MRELETQPAPTNDRRALRILAKSVYRELKTTGYHRNDMVAFTNELLDLVAGEIGRDAEVAS